METAAEKAGYVRSMLADLNNNKFVDIGFCGRQDDDFIQKLQDLQNNSEFGFLIDLLVNQGPDGDDGGDIKFTKLGSGLIKAEIMTIEGDSLKEVTLTWEKFKMFADLTVDFALFCCDNGDIPLNINL